MYKLRKETEVSYQIQVTGIPKVFGLSHKKEVRNDSYFNLKHQLNTVPNVTFYKLLECNSLVALFNPHRLKREAKGTHTPFQGTHTIAETGKDL